MAIISADIQIARKELASGNLIGFPTETVYGLAGNALSVESILKIFKTKNRPAFDPLIVHTHSLDEIKKYISELPAALAELIETFTPGPLTILLPKNYLIPDIVTSGLDRVAFRIPSHPLALELLRSLDFPLAAPSANPFGYVSPTCAQHVEDQLGEKINYILDGGSCNVGVESTIIGTENNDLFVYRLGGISVEALQQSTRSKIIVKEHSTSNPSAPGMLLSHYSPKKRLLPVTSLTDKISDFDKIGFIGFDKYLKAMPEANQLLLSTAGSTTEAAKNLFRTLREIEKMPQQTFYVSSVPNEGLGRAVNDRLKRAMHQD